MTMDLPFIFQSIENIKKLIHGLNILEKYGRHLLKPADQRSDMWRHIKYSNNIFRERIDVVKVSHSFQWNIVWLTVNTK